MSPLLKDNVNKRGVQKGAWLAECHGLIVWDNPNKTPILWQSDCILAALSQCHFGIMKTESDSRHFQAFLDHDHDPDQLSVTGSLYETAPIKPPVYDFMILCLDSWCYFSFWVKSMI